MTPRHVALIIGTRPEAIKMAPLVLALRRQRRRFRTSVIATAQHRALTDQVLRLFHIVPEVDFNLMRQRQEPGDLTARLLQRLCRLWSSARPDLVLVQGDTTSSFAAGLAAYYLKIPIAHVEAGLRTRDKYAPFPEEMNRRLIDALADYYFAPTRGARAALLAEGVPARRIFVTGNTGLDALRLMRQRLRAGRVIPRGVGVALRAGRRLVFVTAHRRESFGRGLRNICVALRRIARARPEAAIVYPVHPNPQVRGPVRRCLRGVPNIHLLPPLEYAACVDLMARADVILTDSGGIQEEAPSLGVPVLVLRDVTERPEAVAAGAAQVVGTDPARIVRRTLALLDHPPRGRPRANPFGDGRSAERIVRILDRMLP